MDEKRRKFLKIGLIGTGVVAASSLISLKVISDNATKAAKEAKTHIPDDPNKHWGFVIDLSKCDGCENLEAPTDDPTGEKPRCTYACRVAHYYRTADPPQYWIRVNKQKDNFLTTPYFFPKPCQNCQNPPCEHVCPTGATFQRKDGSVLINHEICIGCRMCMAACPYDVRFFWWNDPPVEYQKGSVTYSPEFPVPFTRGTVIKCDLCIHNVYNNLLPHCVSACPKGALYYGNLNEDAVSNGREVIPFKQTINERSGYRYKEEENTDASVYYLPAVISANSNSVQANLDLNTSKSNRNSIDVSVKAHDHRGTPLVNETILISRMSSFGRVLVGKGKTDRKGNFKCRIGSNGKDKTLVICELEDTKYVNKEVSKYV